ncbi:MAG: glycosyltransferase family 39 protein [Planctomycetota bacterium]|nr:glycosyltransferase family 39 protein [Planctomycetota bacterium]
MDPTHADAQPRASRPPGLPLAVDLTWLLACVAVALHLRTTGLDAISLWTDEFITLITVRRPLLESLTQLQDYAAPLHQLILRLLVHDAHPPSWLLRSPAVTFGVLGVPAAWWLARLAAGRGVAACVALLVSVNPELILHAREARQNTLFVLLAVVATAALLELRSRSDREARSRRTWTVLYIIAATLLAYAHYFGLLVIAAHVAFVLTERLRAGHSSNPDGAAPGLLPSPAAWLAIALLIAPTVGLASRYLGAGAPATIGWIDNRGPLGQFALLAQLLGLEPDHDPMTSDFMAAFGAIALVPVLLAFIPGLGPRGQRPALRLCAWWMLAGIVIFAVVRAAYRPILVERYALPVIVPALVLALSALRAVRSIRFGGVLALGLALTLAWTSLAQRERATAYRSDSAGLVRWVHEHARPGDERWIIDWPTSPDDVPPEAVAMEHYGMNEPDAATDLASVVSGKGPVAPGLLRLNYPRDVHVLNPEAIAPARRAVIISWVCGHEAVRECLRGLGRQWEEHEFGGMRIFVAAPK